jgi:large subunit ribosomal protein L15
MKRTTVARGGKRGKTSGRGGKGQSARAGNKRRPEWRDIIKKLPKLRGRGVNQNKPVSDALIIVNIAALERVFSANDAITPTILVEKGLVSTLSGVMPMVKILGDGEVTKAFKISGCTISGSAKAKIEKAGGSVVALSSHVVPKQKGPSHESDKNTAPVKVEKKEVKKEKKPKAEKKEKLAPKEKKV